MSLCTEKKTLLSGGVKLFSCELVHLRDGFGVLRYVIDHSYDINGVKLRPGDITLALYWTDRPYTLYIWYLNKGTEVAYYFNIADQITLQPQEFAWRDLVVDILIDPRSCLPPCQGGIERGLDMDSIVHVLDEHELPADLSPEFASYIQSTKDFILREYRTIIHEADATLRKLRD
jgi:hypothetical protein